MMEMPCETMKALRLPITLAMRATSGITRNVVTIAPTLPNKVGQTPTAEASSLNKWLLMMKNVKLAMVLKPLKIRKVEMHNFLKGAEENASLKL
ncbi:MAG: Uncharacterised protein [Cryomorphaceae bacterium]|nr:MAG: Uncharacterised protein [Cryomorphaceae bacterium]